MRRGRGPGEDEGRSNASGCSGKGNCIGGCDVEKEICQKIGWVGATNSLRACRTCQAGMIFLKSHCHL